jgi:hypothetical protein
VIIRPDEMGVGRTFSTVGRGEAVGAGAGGTGSLAGLQAVMTNNPNKPLNIRNKVFVIPIP